LAVAATMGQVASAFPTAGGLYHWAAILGGRGWGWATAWFNLAGLITVLAAINVGTIEFAADWMGVKLGVWDKVAYVAAITFGQALLNHFGIRLTSILTDFSGWWILAVSIILTLAFLFAAQTFEFDRLITFKNYSGLGDDPVLPKSNNLVWLFALGLLLPAYTLTGFDASAHVAEETLSAAVQVPRAIVRSVWVSGLFGWIMLCAAVLAMPSLDDAAAEGTGAFVWTMRQALPSSFARVLFAAISLAHFLCGLATVTSASRMSYAFARDGGLPFSTFFRQVSEHRRSPVTAIWLTATMAVIVVASIPYATIAAMCAVLLYISYVLPTILGLIQYRRGWTRMGPWSLGRWYRPLGIAAVIGCLGLLLIGIQPPNEIAFPIVSGFVLALLAGWFAYARKHFPGPPRQLLESEHLKETG
jgi:amino acid transporter